MTAIAGMFRLDGKDLDPDLLHSMAAPVRHRGPGEPDIQIVGNAGLVQIGMPATSPAGSSARVGRSESGRILAVFDGRLDAVKSLQADLGIDTASASHDVDLLIAAFERWGDSLASHLSGDFSFAILNTVDRLLLCGRDPIGPRMFSYAVANGAIYFSTEIKQLFQAPGVSAELDDDMLGLFLSGAAQYGDATMYKQIKRLQGGYLLKADGNGSVSTAPYWDMRDRKPIRHSDRRDYADDFKARFFGAVTDRLRGDGPASILLSGGLDSGAVACVAGATSADHGRTIDAFYFQQSNPEFDELPYAHEICDTYGISLTTVDADEMWAMKQDLLADIRDEPFVVPFELLNQEAVKLASAGGSRTVLTGEGGDEGFAAGHMLYLRDWLRGMQWKSIYRELRNGTPEYRATVRKNLNHYLVPGFARRMLGRYRTAVPAWVNNSFGERTDLKRRLEDTLGTSYMNRNYFTGRGSHPFHILWDHRAGSFGMEPAHPLWDLRIVEFLSLIPPEVRLDGGTGKDFMKAALQDVLTPGLLTRTPYAAMTRLYMRGWHEEAQRFLANCRRSELQNRNVIDASQVDQRYRQYLAGDQSKSARLFWSLIADDWLLHRYPQIAATADDLTTTAA